MQSDADAAPVSERGRGVGLGRWYFRLEVPSCKIDPRPDLRNTRRISAVVLAGKLLRRSELDALLREAEQLAARN